MRLSEFDYELPSALIAQRPLAQRDASRLLLLEREDQRWQDHRFSELPELLRGDELIIVNDAKVLPARLFGRRAGLRAQRPGRKNPSRHEFLRAEIEVLLTRQIEPDLWEALVRPGRKVRTGERIVFGDNELEAEVVSRGEYGVRQLRLRAPGGVFQAVERLGHMPLPPYINRPADPADGERYQTIFARHPGAVAAPTAGLHFTTQVLARLRERGVEICAITLQVGLGTFQPIRCAYVEDHRMHAEDYVISEGVAERIAVARRAGRPILAVGTTVVRALEDAGQKCRSSGSCDLIRPGQARAEIFIFPGYEFRVVDQLLTNFHLPKSSLLILVSAFANREVILRAYQHAAAAGYRFYSYGDCMLIR